MQMTDKMPYKMKKHLKLILIPCAFVTMALSMPSCPGKEVQDQLDAMKITQNDMSRKVSALTGQVTTLSNEMSQVKDLLSRMTSVIQAQKEGMIVMEKTMNDLKKKKKK